MSKFEGLPDSKLSPEANEVEWGNNVTLDIYLARHGKKASFNAARIENSDEVFANADK